jgi:hypothetical protein
MNQTRFTPQEPVEETNGADERSRTADLLITNQLLYQLSYIGVPDHSIDKAHFHKIGLTHRRELAHTR